MNKVEKIKYLAWLKNQLLTAVEITVVNATYSYGNIAFGDLEDLSAGSIVRRYDRSGDLEYYAFFYKDNLFGEPIKARLMIGDKVLNPGEHLEHEY